MCSLVYRFAYSQRSFVTFAVRVIHSYRTVYQYQGGIDFSLTCTGVANPVKNHISKLKIRYPDFVWNRKAPFVFSRFMFYCSFGC